MNVQTLAVGDELMIPGQARLTILALEGDRVVLVLAEAEPEPESREEEPAGIWWEQDYAE